MYSNDNNLVIRSGRFPELNFNIKKEDIFPLKKVEFEGYDFYIPNKPEEYLKSL